jgi:hypothetical protein
MLFEISGSLMQNLDLILTKGMLPIGWSELSWPYEMFHELQISVRDYPSSLLYIQVSWLGPYQGEPPRAKGI